MIVPSAGGNLFSPPRQRVQLGVRVTTLDAGKTSPGIQQKNTWLLLNRHPEDVSLCSYSFGTQARRVLCAINARWSLDNDAST